MKKKILIITTGGTLACVQNEKGLVPGLSSNDILSYISDITNLYDVDFYELFQLDSANIQPSNWQTMAETIYEKYTSYELLFFMVQILWPTQLLPCLLCF